MSARTERSPIENFDAFYASLADTYSGDQLLILQQMLFDLGHGGLNDAAGVRAETGDCVGCDTCTWCKVFDFALDDYNWALEAGWTNWHGRRLFGEVWACRWQA